MGEEDSRGEGSLDKYYNLVVVSVSDDTSFQLDALRDMLNADDFKKNIGPVIQRIYQLAFDMFSDLPRGHHKTNAMHKMANKTMIGILPQDIMAHIEKKCGSLSSKLLIFLPFG